MRRVRKVSDYAKIIAKETGLPKWKVHLVLMFAWKNVVYMISRGEELRIKGFGRIYIDKTTRHGKKKGSKSRPDGDRDTQFFTPRKGVLDDL